MEGWVRWRIILNILFLSLRLSSQKGECGLPHTTEGPRTYNLQHGDRGHIVAELQADAAELLPSVLHSAVPSVQTLVQPAKP